MSTNNSNFNFEWKSSSNPIKKETDDQEYNILLLGVTGSGKSTFINSAYNYLKYSSLEEAIVKGDINKMFIIPTKINMTDSNSINYSFSINGSSMIQTSNEIGNKSNENGISTVDNNEVNPDQIKIGESVTRVPKKYPLLYNGRLYNFIDTCGIGDTRGIQQDSINFELILSQISQLKYLHGICIFMKPNDSRSTILYKWCLNELLTKLHHSAKDNIMFCFPNSRGTFFRSGDSQLTLKNYLQQLKLDLNIDIENSNNCNFTNRSLESREFYFDNDALHFLAVKSQGGHFDQTEQAQYHYSWTKSSVSLKRLLTKIQSIPPHDVRNTISINYAREMISQLAKPMSVCLKNINDNLNEINKHKKKLRKSLHQVSLNQQNQNNITIGSTDKSGVNDLISKELQESLFIPIIQVTSMPLSRPKAVCINSFCIEKEKYKLSRQIDFPSSSSESNYDDDNDNTNSTNKIRFCCENCFGGLLGNLYLCFSYDVNGKCKSCYKSNGSLCHHSDHIIIKSIESNNQIKNQLSPQNQSNDNIENIKENTNQLIKQLKERKKLYEKEFQEISNASVHFSLFLSKNSLIQVNNEYENFINLQISNEKSQDSIKILVKHLQDYKIQVDSQRKAIESGKTNLKSAKEIIDLVNEIKNLQLVGHIINSIQLTNNSPSFNNNNNNQNEIIIQKSITTKKILTNLKNKLL
ncbi:hypothetical protein ACTFIY_011359 [Dictyostelium cf. discoideum]